MSAASRLFNNPRFYRLINRSASESKPAIGQDSPEKLTQSIIRNNNFVYIDINQKNGLCQMEAINPEEADQDAELLLGDNYLCSIGKLSAESQKAIDYLYKARQFSKQKQKFKQLLKKHLQVSLMNKKVKKNNRQKFRHLNDNRVNCNKMQARSLLKLKHPNLEEDTQKKVQNISPMAEIKKSKDKDNVIIYRGMQTKYLREYLQKKQLDEINSKIFQREKSLIEKYGFTNNYETVGKQKSSIIRKNRKIILPQIKSVPNFLY